MLYLKIGKTKDKVFRRGKPFFNYDYYRFFGRCIPGE